MRQMDMQSPSGLKQAGAPFRVLCLDGGGMRGLYTAAYLSCLESAFARKREIGVLDIGKAFRLIVGTSTGAMIGCALAAGIRPERLVQLYREHGRLIFPRRVPSVEGSNPVSLAKDVIADLTFRPGALREGRLALEQALDTCFGGETLGQVYSRRGVALAIPAVEMTHHRGWVFKTAHLGDSAARDNEYRLVDVCLATTAAPVFRSLAAIPDPGRRGGHNVFADGGLWANNPVLVGLIEALQMTEPGDRIEIFCLGTCPRPAGERVGRENVDWGLMQWGFGASVAELTIDVQEFAFDHMARLLGGHVNRQGCDVVRFPRDPVPAKLLSYLDLDDTTDEAAEALLSLARADAQMTNSRCSDQKNREGALVRALFMEMPELPMVRHA